MDIVGIDNWYEGGILVSELGHCVAGDNKNAFWSEPWSD